MRRLDLCFPAEAGVGAARIVFTLQRSSLRRSTPGSKLGSLTIHRAPCQFHKSHKGKKIKEAFSAHDSEPETERAALFGDILKRADIKPIATAAKCPRMAPAVGHMDKLPSYIRPKS